MLAVSAAVDWMKRSASECCNRQAHKTLTTLTLIKTLSACAAAVSHVLSIDARRPDRNAAAPPAPRGYVGERTLVSEPRRPVPDACVCRPSHARTSWTEESPCINSYDVFSPVLASELMGFACRREVAAAQEHHLRCSREPPSVRIRGAVQRVGGIVLYWASALHE